MRCRFCKSKRIEWFLPNMKSRLDKKIYHYLKCINCGSIFLNQVPPENQRKQVYNNPSYYLSWEREYQKNIKVREENDTKKARIFRIKTRFTHGHRILDIGCAFGTFLEMIGGDFIHLYGTEYSDFAIKHINKNKIKVSKKFFGAYPPNYFDAVTMWDVLEHTPDPVAYIQEIYRILKKDGVLIMTTPNANSYPLSILKEDWPEIQPPEHIFFMSKMSLRIMLNANRYRRITISCGSRYHLFPPIGFYSIFKKMTGGRTSSSLINESEKFRKNELLPYPKRLLYWTYYLFCKLVSIPLNLAGKGDSLLAVARK